MRDRWNQPVKQRHFCAINVENASFYQ
eukprot:COSAG06_NODE_54917_length_292_cov_0.803109_1_plen_26_part_10